MVITRLKNWGCGWKLVLNSQWLIFLKYQNSIHYSKSNRFRASWTYNIRYKRANSCNLNFYLVFKLLSSLGFWIRKSQHTLTCTSTSYVFSLYTKTTVVSIAFILCYNIIATTFEKKSFTVKCCVMWITINWAGTSACFVCALPFTP